MRQKKKEEEGKETTEESSKESEVLKVTTRARIKEGNTSLLRKK